MRDVAIVFVQFVGIVGAFFIVLFGWFILLVKSSDAMHWGLDKLFRWLAERGKRKGRKAA